VHLAKGFRHLLAGALACLMVIGLSATYWAIAGGRSLLLRDDNPRKILALAAIQRGSIYDRKDRLLAETIVLSSALQRHYPRPATYSAVGYYSLRYGAGGAEAAYDDLLSGSRQVSSLADYFERNLLRSTQIGADIRLSLDADLQHSLTASMSDARGAAVVLNAWTGEIHALLSMPGFDPNTLDEDWDALVAAAGQPFFNRALQGNYQLGGTIYTVLMAEAIASSFDLSQPFSQADALIELEDGLTISCVIAPDAPDLTLVDAYVYGCPAPFQALLPREPRINLDAALQGFAFDDPITLSGFPHPEPIEAPAAPSAEPLADETRKLRAALGQGNVTTTPLHMAALMAAIATDGSVRSPHLQTAARPPGARQWQETAPNPAITPVVSPDVAKKLQAMLRQSWSVLRNAPGSGKVGAQAAISWSGEESQIWLNGFSASADGAVFAFVFVLEDSADLSRLLAIGQALLDVLDSL